MTKQKKSDVQTQALIKILENQKDIKNILESVAEAIDLLIQIQTEKLNKEK